MTHEQVIVFQQSMERYGKLLEISQEEKFMKLAQNVLDVEVRTNNYSDQSTAARKQFTIAYSQYTLFELQAAYRHFTNAYTAWMELLKTAQA